MKRPLLVLAVGYIIGIVWGLYCNCSIALLYVLIYSICFIVKLKFKSKKQFKMFSIKRYFRYLKLFFNNNVILTILISSFISNSIMIYQNKKYNDLFLSVDNVNLVGIIISNRQENEYNHIYKIKVQTINNNNKFKNICLLIKTNKNLKFSLEYGDKVIINGKYIEPHSQRNYNGFDYKQFLKTKKIYGSINVDKIRVIDKKCVNSVLMLSNKSLVCIQNNIKKTFPEKYANLLSAIMLGDKSNLDEELMQDFRDSNIAHVLAVSGIHITYIILGVTKIFDIILGKRKSRFICIIFLIFYMFLTGFSPSVVRAAIMGITLMLSKIIYKKNDAWNSISLSLLCILGYNPFLVLNVGVLLSYGGTIGIIIFNKNISSFFSKIKIKNKRYKYKLQKFSKITKYLKETIAISISVQLMIMPIIIYNYNTIGIAFIITNLLLSVIIGPIIVLGLILIISIGSLKIIIYLISFFLQLLLIISKSGKILPFNKTYIGTPELWKIIIYYSIIFLANNIYKIYDSKEPTSFEYRIRNIISLAKYKIKLKKTKIISCILIICLLFSAIKRTPQRLYLYFIDVGQGDSTLIITPNKKNILIDGGGTLSKSFDVGKSILLPYLLDRKKTKIDYIIVTHMDQDHVGRIVYNNGRAESRYCNYFKTRRIFGKLPKI